MQNITEAQKEALRRYTQNILDTSEDHVFNMYPGAFYSSDNAAKSWNSLQSDTRVVRAGMDEITRPTFDIINQLQTLIESFQDPDTNLRRWFNDIKVTMQTLADLYRYYGLYIYYPIVPNLAFSNYETIAGTIRTDPTFSDSIMSKVEKLIVNPFNTVQSNTTSYLSRPINYFDADCLKKAFVSLVSPSMTGKTQFAFVLEDVKPLYFLCNQAFEGPGQSVYLNFRDLSQYMGQLIFDDLNELRNQFPAEARDLFPQEFSKKQAFQETPKAIYSEIRAFNLNEKYSNFKFRSLGFLAAASRRIGTDFDSRRQSFMRYWSTQPNLAFHRLSLDDVRTFEPAVFNNFCLFLDEYEGFVEFVLLRNVSRAAGLRCVVANTNSDITNLLGKKQAIRTRTSGEHVVWSLVVTNLGVMSAHVFSALFGARMNEILTIANRCTQPAIFREFIEDFRSNHHKYLRPGIYEFVFKAFREFAIKYQNPFDICSFLNFLISSVSKDISKRKTSISSKLEGRVANLSLLLGNGYAAFPIVRPETAFSNTKYFLRDHLYYLRNPAVSGEWLMLTFPTLEQSVKIFKDGGECAWELPSTQFDEREWITSFACMTIPLENSLAKCCKDGRIASRFKFVDFGSVENPIATKRDGNYLEVLTTVSLIDASRHEFGSNEVSLAGQNGISFLASFIRNLIDETGTTTLSSDLPIRLAFSRRFALRFDIERFFRHTTVPFLMPSGRAPPQILQSLNAQGVIKVGECLRLPNLDQLDIKFSILPDPELFSPSQELLAVAECKNWDRNVPTSTLREIVSNALEFGGRVCFISCINVVTQSSDSEFIRFCQQNSVNVYTIKPRQDPNFRLMEIVPYPNMNVNREPTLICIIIEIGLLNPQSFLVSALDEAAVSHADYLAQVEALEQRLRQLAAIRRQLNI